MNEATARNIRVQNRYDELMVIGKHGHYETMFQVVREETASLRQQLDVALAAIEVKNAAIRLALEEGDLFASDDVKLEAALAMGPK